LHRFCSLFLLPFFSLWDLKKRMSEPVPFVPGDNQRKQAEYVLVAEFDIEKGSIVSFQYPSPTGTETK